MVMKILKELPLTIEMDFKFGFKMCFMATLETETHI